MCTILVSCWWFFFFLFCLLIVAGLDILVGMKTFYAKQIVVLSSSINWALVYSRSCSEHAHISRKQWIYLISLLPPRPQSPIGHGLLSGWKRLNVINILYNVLIITYLKEVLEKIWIVLFKVYLKVWLKFFSKHFLCPYGIFLPKDKREIVFLPLFLYIKFIFLW